MSLHPSSATSAATSAAPAADGRKPMSLPRLLAMHGAREPIVMLTCYDASFAALLDAAGVDARYFEIDSELGHLASGLDGDKWAPALKAFMAELMGQS